MNFFQIVFIPSCAGVALIVLLQAFRGQISRQQGVVWGAVWLTWALLIAFPQASFVAARWLGIGRGSDLVFYLAVIGGLIGFLYFHRRYRTLEMRVTELIRQKAIETPERGGEPSDTKNGGGEPEYLRS